MKRITRHYSLRRLTDPSDPDYLAALRIYANNVAADARVNSNEITYWLTHSCSTPGDEFISFGFFVDQNVAGYAQMTLLRKSRLIFLDYIVLDPAYRNLGEYFQFASLLKKWIESEQLEFDYLVGEVAFESTTCVPSKNCVRLVRLFKQMSFGVAQCEYRYPPLGDHQENTGLRAHLVIWSHTRVRAVTRATMLHIVSAIYFQHYAQWYVLSSNNADHFKTVLKQLFDRFKSTLASEGDIVVNGIKIALPPAPPLEPQRAQGTSIRNPIIVLCAIALFSGTFLFLQAYLHFNTVEMTTLFTSTLLIVATAFALCHKESRRIFYDLLKFARGIFGKSK